MSSLLYRNQPPSLLVQSPHIHVRVLFVHYTATSVLAIFDRIAILPNVHNAVSVRLFLLSVACITYLHAYVWRRNKCLTTLHNVYVRLRSKLLRSYIDCFAVLEFSWGKNDYTFVRKWAIWRPLFLGVAVTADSRAPLSQCPGCIR